jgi:hypothetical protein
MRPCWPGRTGSADRSLSATPEHVIETLKAIGAKLGTDARGVVRYVDRSGCKVVDADLAISEVTRLSLRGTWKSGPGTSDAGLRHVGRLTLLATPPGNGGEAWIICPETHAS